MNISFYGTELLKPEEKEQSLKNMKAVLMSAELNKNYGVTISFLSKKNIQELNKLYRSKDKPTDVLSFPTPKEEKKFSHTKNLLGEIIICPNIARLQALKHGHSLPLEMTVLAAHGLFHLLGYDHAISPEEASIQMQGEMFLLDKIGLDPELCLIGRA